MPTASYTPRDISLKTQVLNKVRQLFQLPLLERFLLPLTNNRTPVHFFGKLVPNHYQYPPGSIRRVSRRGINYELDLNNYVEHYLYFGFQEVGHQKLFALCQRHYTIIDVGANIGSVLMQFARLADEGKVIGFEPDSQNYAKCFQQLQMNHFANVTLIQLGLGAEKMTHRFRMVNATNRGMNRVVQSSTDTADNDTTIHVDKLDNVLAEMDLDRLDILKIDVEGFELNVLKGAVNSLKKYHPVLFIELDDQNLRQQGQTAQELITYLSKLGYSIQNADTDEPINHSYPFTNCHFDILCQYYNDAAS